VGSVPRHLAVTLLAEEGVPRHVIKAFAHHADIKVTEKSLDAQPGAPWTRLRGSSPTRQAADLIL
jgi:hypothetical protein